MNGNRNWIGGCLWSGKYTVFAPAIQISRVCALDKITAIRYSRCVPGVDHREESLGIHEFTTL
jgi:hypothetical protein